MAAPTGLVVIGGDSAAELSWDATTDAEATFIVEQAADPDSGWSALSSLPTAETSRSIDGLPNNVIAWFRVIAVDMDGRRSSPSSPVSVVPSVSPPAPSETRIASPNSELVVSAGAFTAVVPPGTVSQPTALTVTPLPDGDGGLPTVDVRLHGGMKPDAPGVAVTLPFPFDPSQSPVVVLDRPDGSVVVAGGARVEEASAAARAAGTSESGARRAAAGTNDRRVTVTSRLHGSYTAGPVVCDGGGLDLLGVGCLDVMAPASTVVGNLIQNQMETGAARDLTARPCGQNAGNMAAIGETHSALVCESMDSGNSRFVFTNRSHNGFIQQPLVVAAAPSGGSTVTIDNSQVPWFLQPFVDGTSLLYPGAAMTFEKPTQNKETAVTWTTDRGKSIPTAFAVIVANTLSGALFRQGTLDQKIIDAFQNCGSPENAADNMGCFVRLALQHTEAIVANAADQYPPSTNIGALAGMAKKILRPLTVPVALTEVIAAAGSAVVAEANTTNLINSAPSERPSDERTGPWIARHPSDNGAGRAFLVDGTDVEPIVDGGTFLCLAAALPVWDVPTLRVLREPTRSTPASCTSENAPTPWDVRPDAVDGNVGRDVLVRNPDGASWLVNSAGEIQTIPDGGTYECLAYTNPVIWNVAQDRIEAWRPVGTSTATCGAGSSMGLTATYNTMFFDVRWTPQSGFVDVEISGSTDSGPCAPRLHHAGFGASSYSYSTLFDCLAYAASSGRASVRIRSVVDDVPGPWSNPVTVTRTWIPGG